MSNQDSDVANAENHTYLRAAGRELVHDVATPLATLQLNLQVLSTYLPTLIDHCRAAGIPEQLTQERLTSLGALPEALEADIRKIRQAVRSFSSVLVPASESQAFAAGAPSGVYVTPRPRILLVEDETVHQEIALKQFGDRYQVDVAANEREAIDLAAAKQHGLVLLDLVLSGRDARPLIGELRSVGAPGLRIILVSNMPLSTIDVRQLKVEGVLEKPFRLASLEAFLTSPGG